jgi:hypothetical protein
MSPTRMRTLRQQNELLGVAAFLWVGTGGLLSLLESAGVFGIPVQGAAAMALVFGWLAVGLLFTVAGLTRGGAVGRALSVVALGLWLLTVWLVLFPGSHRVSLNPNKRLEPTRLAASLYFCASGRAAQARR